MKKRKNLRKKWDEKINESVILAAGLSVSCLFIPDSSIRIIALMMSFYMCFIIHEPYRKKMSQKKNLQNI